MNLSQDPNPSIRPRTDHALCALPSCLPLRGLLPGRAPAWNSLGSPHPTPPNRQTQWAWGTAARDHGERDHFPTCPRCRSNPRGCDLTWIQHSLTWAGWELKTPRRTQPSPPRLTGTSSTRTEEVRPRATWTWAASAGVFCSGVGYWNHAGRESPNPGPPERCHRLRGGAVRATVDRRLQKINLSPLWTNL